MLQMHFKNFKKGHYVKFSVKEKADSSNDPLPTNFFIKQKTTKAKKFSRKATKGYFQKHMPHGHMVYRLRIFGNL